MASGLQITQKSAAAAFTDAGYECAKLTIRKAPRGITIRYTLQDGIVGALKCPESRLTNDVVELVRAIRRSVTDAKRNSVRLGL